MGPLTKPKHVGISPGSPEPCIATCQREQTYCKRAADHGPLPRRPRWYMDDTLGTSRLHTELWSSLAQDVTEQSWALRRIQHFYTLRMSAIPLNKIQYMYYKKVHTFVLQDIIHPYIPALEKLFNNALLQDTVGIF